MALPITPYAIPLFVAALICLSVAYLGWRRHTHGSVAFSVLLVAVALWAAAYGFEVASVSLLDKLLWSRIQYIGIVTVPVAWMVFALQYSGNIARVPMALLGALLVVPTSTLVLLWNPSTVGLIWRSAGVRESSTISVLELTYGPWFWVHTSYSYAIWAVAAAIFLRTLFRAPHLYRKQGLAVAIAIFAPWILNVVYLSGLSPVPLDPTPFGFTITGVAALWTVTRQQFLDIMPVARAAVIEGIRDGVVVLDADERIVDLNPAAEEIIGMDAGDVLGEHFNDAFSGRIELHELVGDGNELQVEVVLTAAGATPRNFELRSWPLDDGHGEDNGRLIVFRDISGQKRAEEALRGSEERLRVVIEQMPAVLWTTDAELKFTQMLGRGLQQLRMPSNAVNGMDLFEFFGTIDETHPAIAAHLRALEGLPSTYAVELFGRDLECHVEPLIDAQGAPNGIIGVGLDVTEREDLQEQLRQSQKLEAIGRMAGGVAHDFNNLLTAVAGYAQLAQEDLAAIDDEPHALANLRRDLDAIEHASERATSITAQLLAFSRRQVLQPRVLDMNAVIEEMDKMMRRLVGEHVELLAFLDPEVHRIKADPVQIQQVLINLVLNSRDAMPQGGKVNIETMNVEFEDSRAVRYDVIGPGNYAALVVTDNGFGMDERTQQHLFEPFFTTKEEGKGTGLGLSTVYGIVKQSGGFIEVASRVGEGSTFKIYFPAAEKDEAAIAEEAIVASDSQLRGTETVLLVEDEEMVRVLATRVLNSHGYLVLEAEDAEEAIEMCGRHEGPIHLIITDVVMPGMNGRELVVRLSELLPDSAVLYISGYTGGALVEHGVLETGTEFLQKPFSPHRLTQKVREVLDRVPSEES